MKLIKQFMKEESGSTAIEYGLIAALVSVVIIAGLTTLGTKLDTMFNSISKKLTPAT